MFGSPKRRRPALSVEALEDRSTPAFGGIGGASIAIGNAYAPSAGNEYVLGTGPGQTYGLSGRRSAPQVFTL